MMWVGGTFEFENELVMLSEGTADRAFLEKLVAAKRLPKFDFPWPVYREEHEEAGAEAKNLYSKDKFGEMLVALDGYLTLRPELVGKIKGVMIVADAMDDPDDSFKKVARQIPAPFGAPSSVLAPGQSTNGRPLVAIMLVPRAGRHGSLETICVREMKAKMRSVAKAMRAYLTTPPIKVMSAWKAEKRDKSQLACMIAATHEKDPTKTLTHMFSGKDPLINVRAPCFRPIAKDIREFCRAAGVTR